MSQDIHERAARLIFRSQVEAVGEEDLRWLDAHLAVCQACAERAAATKRAIQAVRSASVQINPALVEMTRLRVRRRAEQLGTRRVPGPWFWIVSALSWIWIAASAPYLWRGFGWMAHKVGIPSPIWQMSFALWWAVPALFIAAALSIQSLQDASPMKIND